MQTFFIFFLIFNILIMVILMKKSKFLVFLSIFIPLILGILVSFIIRNDLYIYESFNKPLLAPPKILFPIAWSILYLLIGISYYLIKDKDSIKNCLFINLLLNYLWPIIFFKGKLLLLSTLTIILLLISTIILLKKYYYLNKTSFYLLMPYLAWIIFASYLNISIAFLNR